MIIPARGGSKGVPGKNLRIVGGQPLIAYAIETALNTRCIDLVMVSTDDEQIASVSKDLGVDIIHRPPDLAGDDVSLPEVIKHAKLFFNDEGILPKRFVSLQCTCPLITVQSLTNAIELHEKTRCDSVVSITKIIHGHPYWAKSFNSGTGKISKFLDIDVFKYPQKQDLPSCFTYTGGFYIRKTELLNESKGFYLGEDIRGYLLPSEYEALDIDTEEDMLYFEFLIAKINEREQKLV